MVLAAHAVVGAAVASLMPSNPVLGFTLAFGSHFVLDAIPHWHYPLRSLSYDHDKPMDIDMRIDTRFIYDLMAISLDGIVGIGASLLFFSVGQHGISPFIVLMGAFAGMLPDALQFLYMKWRHEPLVTLQRFHEWAHTDHFLDHQKVLGPAYQIALMLMCLILERGLF